MEQASYYRLDENLKPVLCRSHFEWVTWRCNVSPSLLVVGRDTVNGFRISTMFMPVGEIGGQRHFYETAVFDPTGYVISRETSETRTDAGEQHAMTVDRIGRAPAPVEAV